MGGRWPLFGQYCSRAAAFDAGEGLTLHGMSLSEDIMSIRQRRLEKPAYFAEELRLSDRIFLPEAHVYRFQARSHSYACKYRYMLMMYTYDLIYIYK